MKLVQCKNGHYYNEEISLSCPVCGEMSGAHNILNNRVEGKAEAMTYYDSRDDITVPIFDEGMEDSPTVAIFEGETNWSPVVGWIVCVEGKSRGKDYRLHPERNFVGRSGDMDVSIFEDEKIAMRFHCSIVFEPNKKEFMLVPGKETATIFNGKVLEEYVKLKDGDKFSIGNSTFEFVPYCKEGVSW